MEEEEKVTSSTDLYFVAALMALGATHSDTDKEDPRHQRFQLTSLTLDFPKIQLEWSNHTLQVPAYQFADAIRTLKSVVHSGY